MRFGWITLVVAIGALISCAQHGASTTRSHSAAYREGEAEARRDIRSGKLILKEYGLLGPWSDEYQALMRSRYGVEIQPVAGCIVTSEITDRAGGYNSVSFARISQLFGKDVVKRTDNEAREIYRKKHPQELGACVP